MSKLETTTRYCIIHKHAECTGAACDHCADMDYDRKRSFPRDCRIFRLTQAELQEAKLIARLESAERAQDEGKRENLDRHTFTGAAGAAIDDDCDTCSLSRENPAHYNDTDTDIQFDRLTGKSWKPAEKEWWEDGAEAPSGIPEKVRELFATGVPIEITYHGARYARIRGVIVTMGQPERDAGRDLLEMMHRRQWEVVPTIGYGNGPVPHTAYVKLGYRDRNRHAPAGGTYYWLLSQGHSPESAQALIKAEYQ
jgi:hypothetical protein